MRPNCLSLCSVDAAAPCGIEKNAHAFLCRRFDVPRSVFESQAWILAGSELMKCQQFVSNLPTSVLTARLAKLD
jgi:hypothetical protein